MKKFYCIYIFTICLLSVLGIGEFAEFRVMYASILFSKIQKRKQTKEGTQTHGSECFELCKLQYTGHRCMSVLN